MSIGQQAVDQDRRTAMIVGGLFIVALVPFLIGGTLYGPSTGTADFLENAYPDRAVVTLGVLIEFIAVIVIPLIGVFMFPVLRRFHEALALAYVAFRSLEAIFLIAIEAKVLALIGLSDTHLNTAGSDASVLQAMGDALLQEKDQIFALYVIVFGLGALIFYGLLYYSRLIPRWLSGWGFVAAALMVVGNVLFMFVDFSRSTGDALELVVVLPVPLQEITLAFWLIFKGFDSSAHQDDIDLSADRATING